MGQGQLFLTPFDSNFDDGQQAADDVDELAEFTATPASTTTVRTR